MVKQLGAFGYRIEVSSDYDRESTSFDGLLFASSPRKDALFDNFVPMGREQICSSSPVDRVDYLARVLQARAAKG